MWYEISLKVSKHVVFIHIIFYSFYFPFGSGRAFDHCRKGLSQINYEIGEIGNKRNVITNLT